MAVQVKACTVRLQWRDRKLCRFGLGTAPSDFGLGPNCCAYPYTVLIPAKLYSTVQYEYRYSTRTTGESMTKKMTS